MKIPEFLASLEKSDLGTQTPSSEVCQSLATTTPVKEAWLLWPLSMRTPQLCHSPNEPVSPFTLPVWTLRSLQFEIPRGRPAISCNGFQTGFHRDPPASGGVGAGEQLGCVVCGLWAPGCCFSFVCWTYWASEQDPLQQRGLWIKNVCVNKPLG